MYFLRDSLGPSPSLFGATTKGKICSQELLKEKICSRATLKVKNLLPWEQILFFKSTPKFEVIQLPLK